VSGTYRVRRSRHLVCHWAGGVPVIVNYATNVQIGSNAVLIHVLTLCDDWMPVGDVAAALPSMPPRDVRALVNALVDRTLLARSDRDEDPREAAMETWSAWNPAAGFFHFTTKNVPPPPDLEAAEHELRAEYAASGSPPRFKRYPRARTIALPSAARGGEFTDVLLARRTWRSFADEAIALDDLATLLGLTCGVQRTADAAGLGTVHLTTSPSGGARHPLEAYVLAVRVNDLAPGLYHYASGEHALERVSAGASAAAIRRYIPGQWWYESAAALFILTAVFPRTQWRYKTPRAYRNVLLEAGHVVQTFCLAATWLGLAPFCTARFSESVVESAIRADGVTESFVYGGGVGRRPAGFDWAPWPIEHERAHPWRRVPRPRVKGSSASR
jgi:SagB-type dehydrogenase family enzyme